MYTFRVLLSFFLSLFFLQNSWAQEKNANFILKDSTTTTISLKNIKNGNDLKEHLYRQGYFFFYSEKIKEESTTTYLISLGKKTSVIYIQELPELIKEVLKTNKNYLTITPSEINNWTNNLNLFFDKRGENFSEIQLTNQKAKNDTLFCNLKIRQSSKRKINKIVIKGYERFPKSFIKHYIKNTKPFSKDLLTETEQKINQLKFVSNTKKPGVLFTKDSTHLYLYLNKIKANKLDALFGFTTEEESGDIQFNGYIDISLVNTIHKGESFAFSWKNTGQEQEEIDLRLNSPYLFKTPISLGYHLNIYKQDSSFVNTQNKLSLGYQPHFKHTLNTYYKTENSTTLNETSVNQEYQKNIIGFTYSFLEVNELKLPQKKISLDFGYGNKKTETTTKQQIVQTDAIYNIKITSNNHIYLRNRNSYLRSENKTINELFRTGGATTIRGFLEQSIIAHLYNYSNIEYRFFTNNISYLYGFSDFGYFKNIGLENRLLSFGAGYTFGTSGGLLKISYAVGKNNSDDFNLNTGLFHINFVTLF